MQTTIATIAIIGAGPAGLTAGYLLSKENKNVIVLEADSQYVGGIARTVVYKGYCFDIGGHRFFSKAEEIEALWSEILPNDMLWRKRSSRIFYNKAFFSYPLKIKEVITQLGWRESFYCLLSYFKARFFPVKNPVNFTDWVSNHFGKRLFSIFFKTYTEKVWGMKCDTISADWAAQRIKGLSFFSALFHACFSGWKKESIIKTLIDSFRYPRKGPGMLWEACAEKIHRNGGSIKMGCSVKKCDYDEKNKCWKVTYESSQGEEHFFASHVISSAPLRDVVLNYITPTLSSVALNAAKQLKYRDFLIVVLILKDKKQFDDNWIYIHDPSVDVARIQHFKSWSPDMVPDPTMCCYGMEYFCFEGDGLWTASDEDLIQKAKHEIEKIGLAEADTILDGCVVRQSKAYPVYDENYKTHVDIIRREMDRHYPTFYLVGRNGMHKYNNQDHAMMTSMLTVKNILSKKNILDVWNVNQDAEYIEAGSANARSVFSDGRLIPEKVKEK